MNEAVVTLKVCHRADISCSAVRGGGAAAGLQSASSTWSLEHVCAHFLLPPPRAVRERERGRLLRAPPQRGWARPGRSGGGEEEEAEACEDCPFVFRWFWNKRKKTADKAQPPPPPPPLLLLLLLDRLNARSGADTPQTPRTLPRTLPQTETAPLLRSDTAYQQKVSAESKNYDFFEWSLVGEGKKKKNPQQSYFPLLRLSACFFVSCKIFFFLKCLMICINLSHLCIDPHAVALLRINNASLSDLFLCVVIWIPAPPALSLQWEPFCHRCINVIVTHCYRSSAFTLQSSARLTSANLTNRIFVVLFVAWRHLEVWGRWWNVLLSFPLFVVQNTPLKECIYCSLYVEVKAPPWADICPGGGRERGRNTPTQVVSGHKHLKPPMQQKSWFFIANVFTFIRKNDPKHLFLHHTGVISS